MWNILIEDISKFLHALPNKIKTGLIEGLEFIVFILTFSLSMYVFISLHIFSIIYSLIFSFSAVFIAIWIKSAYDRSKNN